MKNKLALMFTTLIISFSALANLHFEDAVAVIKDNLPNDLGVQYIQAVNLDGQGYLKDTGIVDIRVINNTRSSYPFQGYRLSPGGHFVVRFSAANNKLSLLGVGESSKVNLKIVQISNLEIPDIQAYISKLEKPLENLLTFESFEGEDGPRHYMSFQEELGQWTKFWFGTPVMTTEFYSNGQFKRAPKKVEIENIFTVVK